MMGIVGIAAATAVAIASIAHHSRHDVASSSTQVPAASPPAAAAAPDSTTPAAAPDPVAATNAAQPEPVRVKNPFDHSEVFEFPPGTSPKEARQSVAQILMQRAHDRGIPTFHPARADRHPLARSKPSRPSEPFGLAQNSR